jgi:hypothetical protein
MVLETAYTWGMKIEHIALLKMQRDLLDIPRGSERFHAYIRSVFKETDDPLFPLSAMNPMGKAHVAERLDLLLELHADDIAATTAAEATQRLSSLEGSWRTALVLSDDLMGGWTNRYLSDATARFSPAAKSVGNWITMLLWTSDEVSQTRIVEETLVSIYRRCYVERCGYATTARQMMRQEGLALRFAAASGPTLDVDDLAYTREIIAPLLDATVYPTAFTCMYGDDAARAVGYPTLGLSPYAGYALARADALAGNEDPVTWLRRDP